MRSFCAFRKPYCVWGSVFATVHLALVGLVVRQALAGVEPLWMMGWLPFLVLDFPVSLLLFAINALMPGGSGGSQQSPTPPLSDVHNFLFPMFVFGICGTLWWFLLPGLVARLRERRQAG